MSCETVQISLVFHRHRTSLRTVGISVGRQSNPSRRGTVEIMQSCLFTILICTWSVQHLNVPVPTDRRVERLRRTIKWITITVLFPEFVLAHAIMERDMAFKSMRLLKSLDIFAADDRPWWKACLDKFYRSSSLDCSSEPLNEKKNRKEI